MRIHIYAVTAGLFFGLWPLFMRHSGIQVQGSAVSTIVMEAVVLGVVFIFGFKELPNFNPANVTWTLLILSGVSAAFGVLAFNNGLSIAGPLGVGSFVVLAMLIQLGVTASYQVWRAGGLTLNQTIGFALSGLAIYFLTK